MRRGIEADVNVGLLPYRYGTDRSNLECWRLPAGTLGGVYRFAIFWMSADSRFRLTAPP